MQSQRSRRAYFKPLNWVPVLLAPMLGGCYTPTVGGGSDQIVLGGREVVYVLPSDTDRYTCAGFATLQCEFMTPITTRCGCSSTPIRHLFD